MAFVKVIKQSILIIYTFFLAWIWNIILELCVLFNIPIPLWLVSVQVYDDSMMLVAFMTNNSCSGWAELVSAMLLFGPPLLKRLLLVQQVSLVAIVVSMCPRIAARIIVL